MIDILLSTYNGEQYINGQIESIFAQTFGDYRLYIRDDGSTDRTVEILKGYVVRHPKKIVFFNDNLGNIGCSKSFMFLLEKATSPYIMFCDQDDVWDRNKVKLSYDQIKRAEDLHGRAAPILVFTDLKVVDGNDLEIAKSFWRLQKIRPEIAKDWKKLLAQNVVTGCTVVVNEPLKTISLPYKEDNFLHDHWIAVHASKYGYVSFIRDGLVLYRQHDRNLFGARKFSLRYIFQRIKQFGKSLELFRSGARYFGDVSVIELIIVKILVSIKRIVGK